MRYPSKPIIEVERMTVQEAIKKQLNEHSIVLYMKGTPTFPQCGFSSKAVHILKQCGVDFLAVNVLEDDEIREGIKRYGNWPTIPQLYVNGELIGGSDIMSELFQTGELQKIISEGANVN
jgi:monothiol glutaredoxin